MQKRNPNAYILRSSYLYGPMNNLYREAFVFDCALEGKKFYLPRDGEMKLQFFHVNDLCRFMDVILEEKPKQHIFNLGNMETISIRDWVAACYNAVGKHAEFVSVTEDIEQENYFCFNRFEYYLDVQKQNALMPATKPLKEGLKESFEWYLSHKECVKRKPYLEYIDENL